MRKNSIDIYTSQHVYPANSFRDSPSERFGFGFGFGFGKRGMTSWQEFCYEPGNGKGKGFHSGLDNLGGFSFQLPFLCEYQHIMYFKSVHIHINYLHRPRSL